MEVAPRLAHSSPRPAAPPHRAVLTVPAHARREDARLDGGEDLRGQPVEADVGGRAWSATMHLQLSGLRQHVEAEAEIGPVGEAVHGRRIAVDRRGALGTSPGAPAAGPGPVRRVRPFRSSENRIRRLSAVGTARLRGVRGPPVHPDRPAPALRLHAPLATGADRVSEHAPGSAGRRRDPRRRTATGPPL
jgi:hypothetical protein